MPHVGLLQEKFEHLDMGNEIAAAASKPSASRMFRKDFLHVIDASFVFGNWNLPNTTAERRGERGLTRVYSAGELDKDVYL